MDEADRRKSHWDKAYADKANEQLSWFQSFPAMSLQMIEHAELPLDAGIVDAGGGSSLLSDHLLEKGYTNLSVLDISEAAIASSRHRLGDRAADVNWIVADLLDWMPSTALYDLWHDRAVFHFLIEESDRRKYLEVLRCAVRSGGQVVVSTFAPDGPERCSGLPVRRYDAQSMALELGKAYLLLETTRETHVTPAGRAQQFTYCRFLKT